MNRDSKPGGFKGNRDGNRNDNAGCLYGAAGFVNRGLPTRVDVAGYVPQPVDPMAEYLEQINAAAARWNLAPLPTAELHVVAGESASAGIEHYHTAYEQADDPLDWSDDAVDLRNAYGDRSPVYRAMVHGHAGPALELWAAELAASETRDGHFVGENADGIAVFAPVPPAEKKPRGSRKASPRDSRRSALRSLGLV